MNDSPTTTDLDRSIRRRAVALMCRGYAWDDAMWIATQESARGSKQ